MGTYSWKCKYSLLHEKANKQDRIVQSEVQEIDEKTIQAHTHQTGNY